jgi:protein ImuA
MVTLNVEKNGVSAVIPTAHSAGRELASLRAAIVSGGLFQGQEAAREVIQSGFTGVDALLPAGGLRRGSLIEWFATSPGGGIGGSSDEAITGDLESGAGVATLAFAVACRLAGAGTGPRTIVVVDRTEWFHPPAVLPWLTGGQQLVVTRPGRDDDEIWAIDQALRCRGVAAVVAWPRLRGQARQHSHWSTALRRWQLAARSSGAVGLLVRPQTAARDPSWAEARIAVEPLPGGSLFERRVRLTRTGGGWTGNDHGRSSETALDLSRGIEAILRNKPPRGQQARAPSALEGGVTCRAS